VIQTNNNKFLEKKKKEYYSYSDVTDDFIVEQ